MSLGVSTEGEKRLHFKIIRFMTESAVKLRVKSVPLATAARIYHKFFSHNSHTVFDPYLVATTCLYLAGKVEEEHLKLRDVINVCYRCMYKEKPPLEIGSTYWALREAVSQCELLILRVLKFHVSFVHPHKFLLHYIKSVYDWLHPTIVERFPIARTAWAILRDSYHGSLCLRYDPEHIAVAALYMALQCYGIEISTSHDAECSWWAALVEDLRVERIRRIVKEIVDVYSLENLPVSDLQAEVKAASPLNTSKPKQDERSTTPSQLRQQPKPKVEPPSQLPMDDVDDIDVFLYSDSHTTHTQPPPEPEPPKKKPKPKSPSPPPKSSSDGYFYSSLVGSELKLLSEPQEPQRSLPGMGSSHLVQENQRHHQEPQQKKPIRIPIPEGKAQPIRPTQSIDVLGQNLSRPADPTHFPKTKRPQPSGSRSPLDDRSYFMGPKSPQKIEEDEDFDLLLFSRSEEPKKEEKKNLFPILRHM